MIHAPDNSTPLRQTKVLLAGLYTSQTLGLAFVTTTVPVIMRQSGAGLDSISSIFLLGLLWSVKFLWAPLVDCYGVQKYGHYRGWIILSQLLVITLSLCAAFLSIHNDFMLLSILFILLTFFAGTQDNATDGLAVTTLKPEERSVGSSIQSAGNMIGVMIGGGVVLIAYDWLGWTGSMLILACAMALPLISVLRYKERWTARGEKDARSSYKAMLRFFRRPGIWRWIPILMLFRLNHQITYWLLNPFLVDIGWDIDHIGVTINIIGLLFGVLGALLGGRMILHYGRKKTMLAAMGLGIVGTSGMIALVHAGEASSPVAVYAVIALLMITYGLNSTVIFTTIMDKCNPASAATDFSLQWSLSGISAMAVGGLAMASAEYIGYIGVLISAIVFAMISMGLIFLYNSQQFYAAAK